MRCKGDSTLSSKPRRRRRDERGASLVEFALILPLFSLLLFGLIDFGLVFGGYITMQNGVSAAARDASVGTVSPACASAANPMLCQAETDVGSLTGVVPGSIKVAVELPSGGTAGQTVEVCAQATMKSTTGFSSVFLGGRAFHASSEIRLEQNATFVSASSPANFSC